LNLGAHVLDGPTFVVARIVLEDRPRLAHTYGATKIDELA